MSIPSMSVVMAVYNGATYLRETIESVLAQTAPDFEFIIVNDGSTEPPVAAVLSGFAARDARIRVLAQPHEGLTRALMAGCAAAQGAQIARIDVGDAMLPERLARQRAVLDANPRLAFVSCWTEICGPRWEPLSVKKEKPTGPAGMPILGPARTDWLQSGPTHHASVMFRRSAYTAAGGYRAEFYYGQDWDLWYRLAGQGWFHLLPQVLQRVRVFPEGISSRFHNRQHTFGRLAREAFRARQCGRSEAPVLARAAALRPKPGAAGRRSRRGAAEGFYFIASQLRQNRDPRCRDYFRQSLRAWPLSWRAWAGWMMSALTKDKT